MLEGGNGSDLFIFSPSDGNDIIARFNLNFNNISSFEPVGRDFEIDKDKIDLKSFNKHCLIIRVWAAGAGVRRYGPYAQEIQHP